MFERLAFRRVEGLLRHGPAQRMKRVGHGTLASEPHFLQVQVDARTFSQFLRKPLLGFKQVVSRHARVFRVAHAR